MSAPDYVVKTVFEGKDLITPAMKAAEASVERATRTLGAAAAKKSGTVDTDLIRLRQNLQSAFDSAEGSAKRFGATARHEVKSVGDVFKGSFMGTFASNALTSGLSMARQGVENIGREYLALDQIINESAVKFGGIDYGSDKFKQLAETARIVGKETKFSANDAASGLYNLAGAGFEADAAMKVLPGMANFAAAAKMDLATGTEIASAALNQFRLRSADASVEAENLTMISDKLAKTDKMSMASMSGLAETASYAATTFTNAGQSIDDFMVMSALLADAKIDSERAGTGLDALSRALTKIKPSAKKAFAEFGFKDLGDVTWDKEKGKVRSYIDVIEKMKPAFQSMRQDKRAALLNTIFDERAARVAAVLLSSDTKKVRQYREEIKNATGTSAAAGLQLTKSLAGRIEQMQNAVYEKGFQIIDNVMSDGSGSIDKMTSAIEKFDVKPIAEGMRDLGAGVKFLVDHTDEIKALGIAFIGIKGAMMATSAVRWGMDLTSAMRNVVAFSPAIGRMSKDMTAIGNVSANPGGVVDAGGKFGATAGQSIFASLQALGVGAAIGASIQNYLQGVSDKEQGETVSAGNRVIQIERELRGTEAGSERAEELYSELTRLRDQETARFKDRGFVDNAVSLLTGNGGQGEATLEFQAFNRNITKAQREYLDRRGASATPAFSMEMLTSAFKDAIKGQTNLTIELTGDGAKNARVTGQSSKGSAPSVDLSKAGAN